MTLPNSRNKGNPRIIFLVLLVLVLFYFVMPKELIHELNPSKWKQTEIPLAYERMVQNFSIQNCLVENKDRLLSEIKETNIEPRILHEEIISTVYGYCIDNNVIITKITFSEISPVNFIDEEISEKPSGTAPVMVTVGVEFRGSFDDVLNLVDDIKEDSQNIGFSHMRLLSMDDNDFMGVMDLKFYAMPLNKVNYEMVN